MPLHEWNGDVLPTTRITFPLNTADKAVFKGIPDFTFAENDVRDPHGLQWGSVPPDFLLRICSRCRRYITSKSILPHWSWVYLRQPAVPTCLSILNRVEQQLIAKGSAAQRIVLLPRGQQQGAVGSCCSYLMDRPRIYSMLQQSISNVSVIRVQMPETTNLQADATAKGKHWSIRLPLLREAAEWLFGNNVLYVAEKQQFQELLKQLNANASNSTAIEEDIELDET